MYIKIESMRLDWYSNPDNQKIIRADLYQVSVNCKVHIVYYIDKYQIIVLYSIDLYGFVILQSIVDCLALGDSDARKVGKCIVLSKDFLGPNRDVHSRFLDAMALVARYERPNFFVTMTCNLYWPEITDQLLPGQTPQDRPDVVARVYHAKLRDLHDFLIVKGHFGKVAA
jgi:hypothetical protein